MEICEKSRYYFDVESEQQIGIGQAKRGILFEHRRNNYEQFRKFNFSNYVDSCIAIMVLYRKYCGGYYMAMWGNC